MIASVSLYCGNYSKPPKLEQAPTTTLKTRAQPHFSIVLFDGTLPFLAEQAPETTLETRMGSMFRLFHHPQKYP